MADVSTGGAGETARPVPALLARLLETPRSANPGDDDLRTLRELFIDRDGGGLLAEVQDYLSANEVDAQACVRLLDFAARYEYSVGVLKLTDYFLARFGRDEALVDFRLRVLLGLGLEDDLINELERTMIQEKLSTHLAFRTIVSINRISDDKSDRIRNLFKRTLSNFMEVIKERPEEELWWGRYYREIRNSISSIRHYLSFVEKAAPTNRYRPAALREAADIAIAGDRWGRDAQVLLRAREAGIVARRPWRADAATLAFAEVGRAANLDGHANIPGTDVYSHLYDSIGSPECAFDHLLDRVLPGKASYTPNNRLLMIGSSLAGGGMERIFANTYRAVASRGVFERVRMALVNFEPGGSTAFYLPESGAAAEDITVLRTDEPPDSPISMLPVGLARRTLPAYRMILEDRPRVIHAWNDSTGLIAAFAGLLAGCPRIFIHFHHMRAINLSNERNLTRSFPACYRRLLEKPEIEFLFVADASAEDYADWWCVERTKKFRRLYNGFTDMAVPAAVPVGLRHELNLPPGAPVLGTVFRFDGVKRPWLWIEAARLVHERMPDVHFVMVGAGAEWEAARARVASYGMSDRFRFTGQVKNVADHLSCFDLFMLTSRVEGLPNSLVEAQLAGVPVISTDVGGARETFVPGVTGLLIDSDRPEALAGGVVACLTDHEWLRRARKRSREVALERFGIERYFQSLIEFYGGGR